MALRDGPGRDAEHLLRKKTNQLMDLPMRQGLELVFQNPSYLNHYWNSRKPMKHWLDMLKTPEAQLDLSGGKSVLLDFSNQNPNAILSRKLKIPVQCLFGREDTLLNQEREKALAVINFESYQLGDFSQCGHYFHLENPYDFVEILVGEHIRASKAVQSPFLIHPNLNNAC